MSVFPRSPFSTTSHSSQATFLSSVLPFSSCPENCLRSLSPCSSPFVITWVLLHTWSQLSHYHISISTCHYLPASCGFISFCFLLNSCIFSPLPAKCVFFFTLYLCSCLPTRSPHLPVSLFLCYLSSSLDQHVFVSAFGSTSTCAVISKTWQLVNMTLKYNFVNTVITDDILIFSVPAKINLEEGEEDRGSK